ncbi:MAG TPA: rod shape-determining protein MreC [Bacillota bacterium]|nr:rod shape-determining protein MreC [Bacillota bacterium]
MHWFANRRFLIIALIFLLLTWVMFVTSRERAGEGKVEYFFNTAMAPLESIFSYCGIVIHDSWKTVTHLAQLKVENDLLRKEIERLRTRQLGLEQLQKENEELREAAGFVKAQAHEMVAAEVISVNPSNWSRTLTINRGKNDGLKKNMAVISPQGVVGRIMEVRDNTAEVILLTDPRDGNYIGGMVKRTQNMVIVTGGGGYLGECTVKPAVDNFFTDLKNNDIIITAATSDLFPKGIPIGRVVKVSYGPNKMVTKAILQPMVKLNKLHIVFVIKEKHDPVSSESSAPILPGGE